jgi:hypothetical protein
VDDGLSLFCRLTYWEMDEVLAHALDIVKRLLQI